MEGAEVFSPSWVQVGEIGLAFVVVILATWLVIYVLKTSGAREMKYVEIINNFTPMFQAIIDRLEDIEKAVGVKEKKRKGEGLFSDR